MPPALPACLRTPVHIAGRPTLSLGLAKLEPFKHLQTMYKGVRALHAPHLWYMEKTLGPNAHVWSKHDYDMPVERCIAELSEFTHF